MVRDHFVQQLLIRQFTNERGRVFCFDKSKPGVADRVHGNVPRDILYRPNYYADKLGNLDEELYKPIENAFAPHLVAMVKDVRRALNRPGLLASLKEWAAAQISRTQFQADLLDIYARRFGHPAVLTALQDRDGSLGAMRVDVFERELGAMDGSEWRAYFSTPDEQRRFVLSDEPVVATPPQWATGTMYLVFLSPRLMIAGGSGRGHDALADRSRNILPLGANGVAMSYSRRYTYAQGLLELESLESMFSPRPEDPHHEAWMRYARQPHFGLDLMLDDASEADLRRHFRSWSDEQINTFLAQRRLPEANSG